LVPCATQSARSNIRDSTSKKTFGQLAYHALTQELPGRKLYDSSFQ
jgi:hypothetical protein